MTNRITATAVLARLATVATVMASSWVRWTHAQLEDIRSLSLGEVEAVLRTLSGFVIVDGPAAARLEQ